LTLGLLQQGTIYEILSQEIFPYSPPTPRWIISWLTLTTHKHWVLATL
jgi:hypothetical protein